MPPAMHPQSEQTDLMGVACVSHRHMLHATVWSFDRFRSNTGFHPWLGRNTPGFGATGWEGHNPPADIAS